MATLPGNPLPLFASNDYSVTDLQALAYGVQFWSDNDVRPTWHFYKTATQSLTANTWNEPQFGAVAFDSDSVHNGSSATIVTQGNYAVEACIQVEAGTSGIGLLAGFQVTAGANNPAYSSGTTQIFGLRGGLTVQSGADAALCVSAVVPWVLYPGDIVVPIVYPSAAVTLDNNTNSSYINGRYVCNFTGLYIGQASASGGGGGGGGTGSLYGLVGATIAPPTYGLANTKAVQAANELDGYIGQPLALTVQRLYTGGEGLWTMPVQTPYLVAQGCKIQMCVKPDRVLASSEQTNLLGLIADLIAMGANFEITPWTEFNLNDPSGNPFFPYDGVTFAQYWNYYVSAIKGTYPDVICNYNPGTFATAYPNGVNWFSACSPVPDRFYCDYYGNDWNNGVFLDSPSGGSSVSMMSLADGADIPFGIAEMGGGSNHAAMLSNSNWKAYVNDLINLFQTRVTDGKTNADIIPFCTLLGGGTSANIITSSTDIKTGNIAGYPGYSQMYLQLSSSA
jgi:hypothetical protein